jgi:hypothetical protein
VVSTICIRWCYAANVLSQRGFDAWENFSFTARALRKRRSLCGDLGQSYYGKHASESSSSCLWLLSTTPNQRRSQLRIVWGI